MDIVTLAMAKAYSDSKGGYTETTKKYVLPETAVDPSTHTTAFGVNGCFMLPEFVLEADKNYKVVVDGLTEEYWSSNYTAHTIGNHYLYNGYEEYNDGKPWLVASVASRGVCAVAFLDPAENEKSHTVAVYEVSETIHTIDPKYLPGVKIDLADYGVDVFTLFAQGGGTAQINNLGAFNQAIRTAGSITLCINGPSAYVETTATKLGSAPDSIHSFTATIPISHEIGDFVCSLFAKGDGTVKLTVNPA